MSSTITGHHKFFEKSKCLGIDGSVVTVSSGLNLADFLTDQNNDTYWRSSGSTDSITETIEIDFASATINRLFLLKHNLKDFNIKYWNGSAWTHFTSVYGLDGTKTNITETAFSDSVAYYEFASVTTTKILISATKTQVANAQKYISQAITTFELGTLVGWPRIKSVTFDRNNRVKKTISGKYSIQKSIEVAGFDLEFKDYPSTSVYNVDIDLMIDLHDAEEAFLVWLCGGKRGTGFFRYTLRGWRLQDLFQMKVSKAMNLSYSDGVYFNQLNTKIEIEESI